MRKQKLVVIMLGLIGVVLMAVSCGPSRVPPSKEKISPIEEEEQIDYVGKPPDELGKDLFSYKLDDQQRRDNWSKYAGKWVLWAGEVGKVTPKLKPIRVEFLPEEYEISLSPGKISIIVDFKQQWTKHLRHLSKGETIYYRARLTQKGYSMGLNYLLFLEEGEIIDSESVEARLVDLAYSSYEQLQELLENARQIAALMDYFVERLRYSDLKSIAIRALLRLLNIELPERTWLKQISLPEKERQKRLFESKIQESLRSALISLHSASPVQDKLYLQKIEKIRETHRHMVEEIRDARKFLEAAWERARESAILGIDDLAKALIKQLRISIKLVLTFKKAWEDHKEFELYQQLIVLSCGVLWQINQDMERISKNIIEVIGNINQEFLRVRAK